VIGRRAIAAALFAVVLSPLGATAHAEGSPDPPDVVLIVTDDQRWDTLWSMPIVRRVLVDPGVSFENAFVVNPICCPSRASILTGDYSHTTGVYRQTPPFGRVEAFDDTSTLATWLDAAGYTTGLFGKYLDGYQHAALTGIVPPGWDRWVGFVRAGYLDYKLTLDGEVRSYGSDPSDYSTTVLADEAVAFLEDSEGPVFLLFAPAAPHAPAIPEAGDEGAFADLEPARPLSFDEADVNDKPGWVRALAALGAEGAERVDAFRLQQYRSLLSVDRAVGRLVDALERTGRLENTLLVFTSDNGIHHGEHRWTKKESPYEESIRVPLVLRWDAAAWPAGTAPDALVLNIDLAPTMAEAAGLEIEADGRSLLPLLDGRAVGRREDFLIEHLEGTNPIPTFCAVRSDAWKHVRYATGEEELYDLERDPAELDNLAGEPSARPVLDALRERLRELCRPAPPGFDRAVPSRMFLAVGALLLLTVAEVIAGRRRRRGGPARR
jgi:N-acetylglucosamine-6-sulfatase